MKSSHSRCRKVQKALLRSRKLYCARESFTAQQKVYRTTKTFTAHQRVLLHNRRFHCTVESFIAQHKSQSCGINWSKVPSVVETEDKPTLQRLPLDFGLNVCAQIGSGKMVLWNPFRGAPGPTFFLEKA